MDLNELIIIGAGPAGISMAAEAINAKIPSQKIIIIEKSHEHSWAIRKFYPEKKKVTANYKGKEAVCNGIMCLMDSSKQETLSYLDQIIAQKKINVRYEEAVHKIEKTKDGYFQVETNKQQYLAKVCSLAIGMFGRPNKPSYKIPSSAKDRIMFDITSRKIEHSNVLVVGGGDTASEYVQFLVNDNKSVTLSYRKDHFNRMNDINKKNLLELAHKNKVSILYNSHIEALNDHNNTISVTFSDRRPKNFDIIVYALGGTTPKNFLTLLGISFNGDEPIVHNSFETSIPGLFLLGDLSAGKKGGSIISAFNSSHKAMKKICDDYLTCEI